MLNLGRPSKQEHEAFESFLAGRDSITPCARLVGQCQNIYDSRKLLVTLAPPGNEDRLTAFLRNNFPRLWRRSQSDLNGIMSLSDRRLGRVVVVIDIIVATGLLFGAIFTLYYVKGNEKRLGFLTMFTTIFAVCVGLLTNAKRSEIFAATATYGAVLVVFVSGQLGNG